MKVLLILVLCSALLIPSTTIVAINKKPTPYTQEELECLAKNIYFESRNQPKKGQYAVAFVTVNRVNDHRFDNSICDVVYAKKRVNNKYICQFSWVCEGKKRVRDFKAYQKAMYIAHNVLTSYKELIDPTGGSLFFHTKQANPSWQNAFKRVTTIGDHIFYKPTRSDLNG